MELYDIFSNSSCSVKLHGKDKDKVLRELAELAVQSKQMEGITSETVYHYLSERETKGSTGFGNEIALPHARIPGMKEFLLFSAVSPRGVEFNAMDKKRVKLFFIILGPEEQVNEHLKILAGVSRALSAGTMKQEMIQSPSVTSLCEVFSRYIRPVAEETKEKPKMKLMMIILYLDDFLYHILEYFIQEGIEGASIIDSFGMGEYISNIPLFASFIGFMNEKKNQSKTIMVMVPEEKEQSLIKGIEEITGDLDRKEGAMVLSLDISSYKGTMQMM